MATIKDLLMQKGSRVFTVSKAATVLEAALAMNEYGVGALVVTEHGRPEGIFTERDVLRRVLVEGRDPASAIVDQVMTREVVVCTLDTSVDEARMLMRNQRVRHLPVVDGDGGLAGMISIGDLNAWDLSVQEVTLTYLHEYLYGRV